MSGERLEFLSGVLIVSRNAEQLARFYRDTLNIPLEDEDHGDLALHWGCTLGDIHFAVHPIENFPEDPLAGVGAVKLAFNVFDIDALAQDLQAKGISLIYPIKDLGWSKMTAVRDPDGNFIEFTQLCDDVYRGYQQRREQGLDLIARWQQKNSPADNKN